MIGSIPPIEAHPYLSGTVLPFDVSHIAAWALAALCMVLAWQLRKMSRTLKALQSQLSQKSAELTTTQKDYDDLANRLDRKVAERTNELTRINSELAQQMEATSEIEQKLRDSERAYRSIVEDQRELIIRYSIDGKLFFANQAFRSLFGMSEADILKTHVLDLVFPEDRLQVGKTLLASHATDNGLGVTVRVSTAGDGDEWVQWFGRPLYNDDGDHIGFQAVGRVITALVTAENKLREKENLLRHVSRLSTLGEMVAGITHEIRQPLNSIANFAFATAKAFDSPLADREEKLRRWNAAIVEQVERADEIIRRLRGFARKSDTESLPQSINDVVEDTLALMRGELSGARANVTLDLDARCPVIQLDRIQIEQVLVNLIRNACDAMNALSDGTATIHLATACMDAMVLVSVSDQGPGIQTDDLERVFEPFQTSRAGGLGLGLAISRSIIEEHGGQIWAERGERGLIVKFTLPFTS